MKKEIGLKEGISVGVKDKVCIAFPWFYCSLLLFFLGGSRIWIKIHQMSRNLRIR